MRTMTMPSRASMIALAVALAAGPSPAAAQSFQGSIDSAIGATVDQSTPGQTNVSVTQQQAVINWTATNNPSGGTIVFQPDGTTANFFSGTDFAVLNRVTPGTAGNAIYMGGTINGFAGDFTGGTIYFYSPNGIIIGQNASINVGSLGLTTLPISDDGQGNWMSGFGTSAPQVTFGLATDPNSFVRTETAIDGSINANGAGSYVALVAPQITHNGVIRTDTAAALVAAEAATITFSPDGLFNIQVTTGTDAATGIAVSGTIDRNSLVEEVGNVHRAYLVAVAKNDAVTMVINGGGSVGFETATSATVEDNAVVLAGGYDIENGQVAVRSGVSTVAASITHGTMSSDTVIEVTGGAAVNSSGGATSFGGDLTVTSGENSATGGNALIDGMNGNPLTIAGDLRVRAARLNGDGSETGLISRLGAQDGSLVTIGGDVTLDSDSFGALGLEVDQSGGNAVGGNAQINVGANSEMAIAGFVSVHADGYGGGTFNATGGNGQGGNALVMAIGGGASLTITGPVSASAQGFGGGVLGDCQAGCGVTGGTGTGGNASVHSNVGTPNTLTLESDVTVSASGWGGNGDVQAGTGQGGIANLGASDGSLLTVGADAEVDASGFGGFGFENIGGLGRGGEARIGTNSGGSIELSGPAFVSADGSGGQGGSAGGTGTGGRAFFMAFNGDIHAFNNVQVTANSTGGDSFGLGGTGGSGIANTNLSDPTHTWAGAGAENGTLTIDGVTVVASDAFGADGGTGGDGGDAIAGRATVHAGNSDSGPSLVDIGDVLVTTDAQAGNGGDGQGGTNGQDGGDGGFANGGRTIVTAAAGNGELIVNAAIASASATGGSGGDGGGGDGGNGGNGGGGGGAEGGLVNIGTESGTNVATVTNDGVATYTSIIAVASANGGNGGSGGFGNIAGLAGNGGDALGGLSTLLVRGSTVNVGAVNLDASAFGGDGGLDPSESPAGVGGDAIIGSVGVLVTNRNGFTAQRGTLNVGTIVGTAFATGGQGNVAGGQWTQGGSTIFEVVNSDATIDSINLFASADGYDPNAAATAASRFAAVNSTVDIGTNFGMTTPDRVSVHVDDDTPLTQAVTAGTFSITASNFVHDETRVLPVQVGAIGADTFNFATDQDLIIDAHLISTGALSLVAPGLIDIEDATSGVSLNLNAGSSITGATMTSGGTIDAFAPGNITLGIVNAGSDINVTSTDGSLFLSHLSSPSLINLDAGADIAFGDATADEFDFEAGGGVNGGDIIAGTSVTGEAVGVISLGQINVGLLQAGGASDDGFAVGIVSQSGIDVGDVDADEAIGFATFGNLDTGALNAGTDVMTLIGGDTTIASITTTGTGRTYHGDAQMFVDAGGPDNFDPSLVFGATPVRSGGSYNVSGPISTGQVQIAAASIATGDIAAPISIYLDSAGDISTGALSSAGNVQGFSDASILTGAIDTNGELLLIANGDLTTGAANASLIDATAGGLATLNGIWQAPDVQLFSNDIEIAANGGIDAGTDGSIRLFSTNATQALIGDGLTGSGYQLSNAEFGRLSGGNVQIAARGDASAEIDMLIGDLDVTGPNAGSTIEDPFGALVFATGDLETGVAGGVMRITGELVGTGFTDTNAIEFYTGRFELDAATGLLEITGGGTDLSGELYIEADRIHVAEGGILNQLAANPQYSGYQDDLNAPAAVQRPDGVIRAGGIDVFPTEAVLVQNVGTADTPAGFLTFGEGPLFSQSEPPAGPIELIINGQLITEGGTLTGVAVRDFLIDENNIGLFTENSMINGCLLAGPCAVVEPPEPPLPPGFIPTPGIQDEVTLIDDGLLPPPEFGNEDFIDDNIEATADGATSPITPPSPLFDSSALGAKGDIDDPVSGSGNPALMETPPSAACPTGGSQPAGQCKQEKQQ